VTLRLDGIGPLTLREIAGAGDIWVPELNISLGHRQNSPRDVFSEEYRYLDLLHALFLDVPNAWQDGSFSAIGIPKSSFFRISAGFDYCRVCRSILRFLKGDAKTRLHLILFFSARFRGCRPRLVRQSTRIAACVMLRFDFARSGFVGHSDLGFPGSSSRQFTSDYILHITFWSIRQSSLLPFFFFCAVRFRGVFRD